MYGHQTCGVSGPVVLQIEKAAAQATGVHAAGRSRFIVNCVVYGPKKHPMGRIINETLRLWFRVFTEIKSIGGQLYEDIKHAWGLI